MKAPGKDNIIIIGKLPPPYIGTTVWMEILLETSLKVHFNLHFLNTNANKSLGDFGRFSVKKVMANLGFYIALYNTIRRVKPALVFLPVSQTIAGFIKDAGFIFISRLAGRRPLIILHGSNFLNWYNITNRLSRLLIRKTLHHCYGAVVLGKALVPVFKPFFPDDKIFVAPNGGNFPVYKKEQRENHTIKLLYIGNLFPAKGPEDILQALRLLDAPVLQQVTLNMYGLAPQPAFTDRLEKMILDYRLPVNIAPAVTGEQKFRIYYASDIFIFTPRSPEGLPYTIIEALSASLPVITTGQGAIPDAVEDSINGFIVRPNAPEEIAQKISYFVRSPEMIKKMGEASRLKYEYQFTEEKMADAYKKIFETVIHGVRTKGK